MNKNKNLVSIVVNCFNGEKFLYQALNSIVKQTYKNWELIFCDNQSKDNSKKIFQSFKNNKFKYFKTKKFLSLYAARNFAISKSKGEFLSFLDVDDLWDKKKLEKQIKLFKDPRVAVVYGNLIIQKNKKKKIYINNIIKEGYIYRDLIKNYNIGIVTAVIRKKILLKEKILFNNRYNIIGDYDLFLKIAKKYVFKAVQNPVATYRIHNSNLSFLKRRTQVNEFKHWYNNHQQKLNISDKDIIKKKITNLEFTTIKFEKKFIKLIIFFLFNIKNLISFKNIIILITPISLLNRIMWFA